MMKVDVTNFCAEILASQETILCSTILWHATVKTFTEFTFCLSKAFR